MCVTENMVTQKLGQPSLGGNLSLTDLLQSPNHFTAICLEDGGVDVVIMPQLCIFLNVVFSVWLCFVAEKTNGERAKQICVG